MNVNTNITNIPVELTLEIFDKFKTPLDVLKLGRVCTLWKKLSCDQTIWKKLYCSYFPWDFKRLETSPHEFLKTMPAIVTTKVREKGKEGVQIDYLALYKETFLRINEQKLFIRSIGSESMNKLLAEIETISPVHLQLRHIRKNAMLIFDAALEKCRDPSKPSGINSSKVMLMVFEFLHLQICHKKEEITHYCLPLHRGDAHEASCLYGRAFIALLLHCILQKDITPIIHPLTLYTKVSSGLGTEAELDLVKIEIRNCFSLGCSTLRNPELLELALGTTSPTPEAIIQTMHDFTLKFFPSRIQFSPVENYVNQMVNTYLVIAFLSIKEYVVGASWSQLFTCRGFDPNFLGADINNQIVPFLEKIMQEIQLFLGQGPDYLIQNNPTIVKLEDQLESPEHKALRQKYNITLSRNQDSLHGLVCDLKALVSLPNIDRDTVNQSQEKLIEMCQTAYIPLFDKNSPST